MITNTHTLVHSLVKVVRKSTTFVRTLTYSITTDEAVATDVWGICNCQWLRRPLGSKRSACMLNTDCVQNPGKRTRQMMRGGNLDVNMLPARTARVDLDNESVDEEEFGNPPPLTYSNPDSHPLPPPTHKHKQHTHTHAHIRTHTYMHKHSLPTHPHPHPQSYPSRVLLPL